MNNSEEEEKEEVEEEEEEEEEERTKANKNNFKSTRFSLKLSDTQNDFLLLKQ